MYLIKADAIYATLGVKYNQQKGVAFVSHRLANKNITLNFIFTTPTISITIRELVLSVDSTQEGQFNFQFAEYGCIDGISHEICPVGTAPSERSALSSAWLM